MSLCLIKLKIRFYSVKYPYELNMHHVPNIQYTLGISEIALFNFSQYRANTKGAFTTIFYNDIIFHTIVTYIKNYIQQRCYRHRDYLPCLPHLTMSNANNEAPDLPQTSRARREGCLGSAKTPTCPRHLGRPIPGMTQSPKLPPPPPP